MYLKIEAWNVARQNILLIMGSVFNTAKKNQAKMLGFMYYVFYSNF